MADADAAPPAAAKANPDSVAGAVAGAAEANPDAATDAELTARAAALVAALGSGDSDAQVKAAVEIRSLAERTDYDAEVVEAANPRTVAALSASGAAAALLQLLRRLDDVGDSAGHALSQLMDVCDAVRLEVCDALDVGTLVQMLHDSEGERRTALARVLQEFTYCDEWMASVSPDSELVSSIMSLPFLTTADCFEMAAILNTVKRLLKKQPTFRRVFVPSRLSLLAELLVLRLNDGDVVFMLEHACNLIDNLQMDGELGFVTFDEANLYVSCVELLGQLYRHFVYRSADEAYLLATRVLATAYAKCAALQPRIQHLLLSCPGALAGVVRGVCDAFASRDSAARALAGFLDALRGDLRFAEAFLLDTHFATFTLMCPGNISAKHKEYKAVLQKFLSDWRQPESLRALAHPLQHQRLAAAVTLASLCSSGLEFKRILATGDFLEILVAALVELALDRFQETPLGNTRDSQLWAVFNAATFCAELGNAAQNTAAADSDDETRAKRRRKSGATLRASDVNVKRRDSTVLLIASRPFYVNGAVLETTSCVLADALSNVETLDPVSIALPNEVPDDRQYELFHAAVEHAYTGAIAAVLDAESLLLLWCIGDHLQMDELCLWCVERIAPALRQDATLLERAWVAALARPSDALCDACATAWLTIELDSSSPDDDLKLLFKRVHDGCAAKELPAAQLLRVLRKTLLASIAADEAVAARAATG